MNRGLGKTLNDGLQLCKYDIVARMDADDICKSNRFETEYKWLKTHEDYDVIALGLMSLPMTRRKSGR